MNRIHLITLTVAVCLGLAFSAGCSASPAASQALDATIVSQAADPTQTGGHMMAIQVTSSAFTNGSPIPIKFTCDAQNVSPQLSWTGLPAGTKSLALITHDPDAPMGDFLHWVIFDIPATLGGLPEGVPTLPTVQGVGVQGANGAHKIGYMGPCPPKGKPHHYMFELYALDGMLGLKPGSTRADLENAMQGHILAQGLLMGTYSR
jgi:Raf kinase inhibitor-like YbhB/YbcL family protein